MNSFKKNKGITLIALVITIIVMLILVAVTINIAVNGGLFGYAGKAARKTEEAKNDEKDWANIATGQDYEQLIAKYTTNGTTSYGLSADGKTFIGKKSIGKINEGLEDNHERGNWDASKNGYVFTEGHFVYIENYTNNEEKFGDVYLCWDEEGVIPSERTNTKGWWDVFSTSGEFITSMWKRR